MKKVTLEVKYACGDKVWINAMNHTYTKRIPCLVVIIGLTIEYTPEKNCIVDYYYYKTKSGDTGHIYKEIQIFSSKDEALAALAKEESEDRERLIKNIQDEIVGYTKRLAELVQTI